MFPYSKGLFLQKDLGIIVNEGIQDRFPIPQNNLV